MRRLMLVAVAALAVAVIAAPALAAGNRVNVPRKFKKILPGIKAKSGLKVRLPSRMSAPVKPRRVYGTGNASKGKYSLDLGIGKNCNGATACYVAFFHGERGGKLHHKVRVNLARGIKGRFRASTCGASCSSDQIEWKQGRVLYEIEYRGSKRKGIRLANQAIRGGPR